MRFPDISAEWHPTKNGGLKPNSVTPGSNKKVWWKCINQHEWPALVCHRTKGSGCPFCSNQTSQLEIRIFCELSHIFNDTKWRERVDSKECDILLEKHRIAIEIDGYFWHLSKETSDKAKEQHLNKHGIRLLRVRDYQLGKISKADLLFKKTEDSFAVCKRVIRRLCNMLPKAESHTALEYLSRTEPANEREFLRILSYLPSPTPESSFAAKSPGLIKEWDIEKNHELTPYMFTPNSGKYVWWRCANGHSWKARINNRARGIGCPYCSGLYATPENNLALKYPDLAKEWHPSKNEKLSPEEVTPFSEKNVWWQCERGHEWRQKVKLRITKGESTGCPFCSGRRFTLENSFARHFPEIAKEWHPSKNGSLTPNDVSKKNAIKVWWLCKCGHEWEAKIYNRANGRGCPRCGKKRAVYKGWETRRKNTVNTA